jgi:hypothetical protein
MIRNFLSCVPFVLLSLRAPDAGGPGGGGGTPAPTAATPPPEPEGNTLEDKLTSAKTHIGNLWKDLVRLTGELATEVKNNLTLAGQFKTLEETAKKEKADHAETKGLLETEKTAHTQTSGLLVTAEKNVTRLETLCDLKGIDKNQIIPPAGAPKDAAGTREEIVSRMEAEKDPRKKNVIANELRDFDAAAKK